MHVLPQAEKPSEGTPFHKISPLTARHSLAAIFTLPQREERAEDWLILTASQQGMVKRTVLSELPGATAQTFMLVKVNEGDRMGWVYLTDGRMPVLMVTAQGLAIRFSQEEVRPMGLVAAGVMGIKLQGRDRVIGTELTPVRGEVFLVASDGTAKRVSMAQFPKQGRYGQGVIAWKLPRGVHVAGMAIGKGTTRATIYLAELAPKSIRLDEAPQQGRAARGKTILELKPTDRVVGLGLPREMPRPAADKTISGGKTRAPSRQPKSSKKRSKL